jgi:hypothetical protein
MTLSRSLSPSLQTLRLVEDRQLQELHTRRVGRCDIADAGFGTSVDPCLSNPGVLPNVTSPYPPLSVTFQHSLHSLHLHLSHLPVTTL